MTKDVLIRQRVLDMVSAGLRQADIRKALIAEGYPAETIYNRFRSMRNAGELPPSAPRATCMSAAEAGIWHLVDLKRAGHSPTKTEHTISADTGRPIRPMRTPELRSYCGSSAAMAAGL